MDPKTETRRLRKATREGSRWVCPSCRSHYQDFAEAKFHLIEGGKASGGRIKVICRACLGGAMAPF